MLQDVHAHIGGSGGMQHPPSVTLRSSSFFSSSGVIAGIPHWMLATGDEPQAGQLFGFLLASYLVSPIGPSKMLPLRCGTNAQPRST
jgi:hypothetical protein